MPEVTWDPLRKLCQPPPMPDDSALEFALAAGGRLTGHGVLQVGVQTLVRVELGPVGRQVEDLDLHQVYRTREPYVGRSIPILFRPRKGAPLEEHITDLVYRPIEDASGGLVTLTRP